MAFKRSAVRLLATSKPRALTAGSRHQAAPAAPISTEHHTDRGRLSAAATRAAGSAFGRAVAVPWPTSRKPRKTTLADEVGGDYLPKVVARRIMAGQPGLFDVAERYGAVLSAAAIRSSSSGSGRLRSGSTPMGARRGARPLGPKLRGGRPPYDAVLMFKVLVLQTLCTLSSDRTEYQIEISSRSCSSWAWRSRTGCRMPRPSGCSASS